VAATVAAEAAAASVAVWAACWVEETDKAMNWRAFAYGAGLTVVLLLIPVRRINTVDGPLPEGTLHCAIPTQDAEFHRSLVKKYADDKGLEFNIVLCRDLSVLDSLRSGNLDLVVANDPPDSLLDGLATSRAFADGSVWAVREDEVEALRHINQWITELTASARFNRMQKRYFSGKTVSLTSISQYDNILRQCADSIGWDWRLLAAVVYHESRFHNDANSSKGALGLMQIRSKRYPEEVLLNPAANIAVGSRYLSKLQDMFTENAAGPTEAIKFALAAYNMGEGKTGQLIDRTLEQGQDASRWDNVKQQLPEHHHTRAYVENVLNTYAYYSKLYPR
jgi:membrane-bound lytic murein transglycosylase F